MIRPVVNVLLATYNGARFLREQVDSVLAQQDVTVHIIAHDDGSTDATNDILAEYAHHYPQHVHVLLDGVRTGSAKNNFAHLLRAATAEYVAFCDQDDVWLPEKLRQSVQAMQSLEHDHGTSIPLLVYSDARVVDECLQTISESLWASNTLRHAASPSFAQLLTENVVTGCTALLNQPLARLMRTMPEQALMHDHWAALLASGLGVLQAIPRATILYRQHSANVVGAVHAESDLTVKLHRLISSDGVAARTAQFTLDRAQAESLLHLHGDDLPVKHRDTVQAFLNLPRQSRLQRLRDIARYGLWRSDPQRRVAQFLDLLRQP